VEYRDCSTTKDKGQDMGSIKKAFDLTGKTALVTGGSRGLGLQIAEALGEQGARIVLSSRQTSTAVSSILHQLPVFVAAEARCK
jgi:NAD(P)-dependent dehydrogenase (short-subunit alcohol dehydrogenase family)